MATHRFRINVYCSERTITEVMRRRNCSRRDALAEVREAWILETENMEPVLLASQDMITFEAGGAG